LHYNFNFDKTCFSNMTENDGEPNFDEWIHSIGGLTENGCSKLEKATVVSLTSIRLISETDIDEIRLGLGDRAIFKAGWRQLVGAQPVIPVQRTPTEPSPRAEVAIPTASGSGHFTIQELAELLKSLPAPASASPSPRQQSQQSQAAGTSASDLASRITAQTLGKNQALRELAASLGQQSSTDTLALDHYTQEQCDTGERCLLPINFATVLGGISGEDDEVVSSNEFGRMVWQSGKKNARNPTPDRLNYGQFYEASARILREIKLSPPEEVQYLDYMRQLGILLQTFTCASVFTLDHLHRLQIHNHGGDWNHIENTLENSTLKKKEENSSRPSYSSPGVRPNTRQSSDGRTRLGVLVLQFT
jgi:hypothetical protein